MAAGNRRRNLAVVAAGLALVLAGAAASSAWGQQVAKIWDVRLGSHVTDLPRREFVDPACGTNGGPPGLAIRSFDQFTKCPEEATGLREVSFIYDDEHELIARALRNHVLAARFSANTVVGQPVIFSFLIDRDGRVQGYRIVADPHTEPELRMSAYALAVPFKGRFSGEWTCTDLPRSEGETPIGSRFIKERCEVASDGRKAVVETRYYYKPGQGALDPFTGRPMVNAFESSARLEVVRVDALPK